VSNTELISMMCHDDAIVKLPRNYTLSVPVRSLLERDGFLVPPELFTFYTPGEGEGKWPRVGERNYVQTRVDFWLLITYASAASRPCRGKRISLGTNRSAKILSVLLLLKNKEIQYKFF
jgi:hypothetical protein